MSGEEEAAGSARGIVDSRRVCVDAALSDPGTFAVCTLLFAVADVPCRLRDRSRPRLMWRSGSLTEGRYNCCLKPRALGAYNFLLLCVFLCRPGAFSSRSRPRAAPLTPRPRGTLLAEGASKTVDRSICLSLSLPKD